MAVTRRSVSNRPAVLVVVLLAVTLLIIDRAGPGAPTASLRSGARDAFASLADSMAWLSPFDDSAQVDRLQADNARLTAELQQAQADLLRNGDAVRQRDDLLALFLIPTYDNAEKLIAPVIAMNATNFDNTIELGKGRSDGVAVGMPVVNAQGLVGRVIQVSESRSSVLVVTDTTSNVGVRVGQNGEIGVAVGAGDDDPLRVDLIDADSGVVPGDVVITNGLQGSIYPPGIVVGTVLESRSGSMDLRRNVTVRPAVDFSRLDHVSVVKWPPPR